MTSYGVVQWSKTASSNSSADLNIFLKSSKVAPSSVNDQFRSVMQSFAKYRDDNNGTLVTGGSTLAATVATNQVFTSLQNGLTVTFGVAGTLGSSATLNVDGLGAANLQLSAATNITTGQIVGGTIVSATYLSSTTLLPAVWMVQTAIQGAAASLVTPTGLDQGPVTGGAKTFTVTSTVTSTVAFTFQPGYGNGPLQLYNNKVAFVLKAPATDGYCALLVSNTASAGTITTSGFTVSSFTGDAVTTSSGNNYVWNLMTINGVSTYMIKALQ